MSTFVGDTHVILYLVDFFGKLTLFTMGQFSDEDKAIIKNDFLEKGWCVTASADKNCEIVEELIWAQSRKSTRDISVRFKLLIYNSFV